MPLTSYDSANKEKWNSLPKKQTNENKYYHKQKSLHHRRHLPKKHWCFQCVSSWNTISSDMRQVVLNLLELRRTIPPGSQVVVSDCTQPRLLDALPRQTCKYSYCQTLVLTDHETGNFFIH